MRNKLSYLLVLLFLLMWNFTIKSQIKGVIKNCDFNLFDIKTSDNLIIKDSPNIQLYTICTNFGDSIVYMDDSKIFYFHFYYKNHFHNIRAYLTNIDHNSAHRSKILNPNTGYALDFDILFSDNLVKNDSDYIEFLRYSSKTFYIDQSDEYLLNKDIGNQKKIIILSEHYIDKY
jgi:hypothetical protein